MPPRKTNYTLQVYRIATDIKVDEIHTEKMHEHDAINAALQIVDNAKANGKSLEVLIRTTLNNKRIGLVTPDEIILD